MSSMKKIYLIIAGAMLVFVVLLFFVISPLVNKIENLSKEYIDGQTELFQIQQKELILRQQEEIFEKTKLRLLKVENSFLKLEDLVNFITSLEKTAKAQNTQFEIKAISPPEKDKQYFTFAILAKTDFPNFLRFIFALENIPQPPYRLIEIKSITIKGLKLPESEGTRAKEVEGNLEIKVYANPQ